MFELMDAYSQNAVIKVVGVGGGGGNAVNHMVDANIEGVDFICANTDAQALNNSRVRTLLQLGSNITKGLGAGTNPEIGRGAALEDRDRIQEALEGADMVFITAGLGGGTGTGAGPIVAEVARDMGVLAVAVVTKPFAFEGSKRMQVAEAGVLELGKYVDSLITIPNEKLLAVLGKEISLLNAFKSANDILLGAVQGIAELITRPGLINVDFADVRTVMSEMGVAMMGSGSARGEDRAQIAAQGAIHSPLLEDVNLSGARGILVNITAGLDLSIGEFDEVGNTVKEVACDDATVVVGTVIDPDMEDDLRVTVVATGLGEMATKAKPQVVVEPEVAVLRPVQREEDVFARPDYSSMDQPTVIRKDPKGSQSYAKSAPEKEMEYLDIPAFLRRQAD
ncbi:MAG: cell division protein FtsZ [Gammaproteobacteria bacterium]|nr:cell division protein FtsZ [Gammaproteobacteria bacterium]